MMTMLNLMKRIMTCLLVAALAFGAFGTFEALPGNDAAVTTSARAEESPSRAPATPQQNGPLPVGAELTVAGKIYRVLSGNRLKLVGFTQDSKSNKTIKIPKTVTSNGQTYTVVSVGDKAFSKLKKCRLIKIFATKAFSISKNAFKGLKTEKMTIKVTEKMSKKEFIKLKKRLRRAGFKGRIVRVKL